MLSFRTFNYLILVFQSISCIVIAKSPPCEVVQYTTVCEVNRGKLLTTDTIIFQINNRSGEKYTEISLPYTSISAVGGLEAWIEDDRGQIVRKLRKQDITDVNAIDYHTLYQDKFIKEFSLRYNEYPYTLYLTYQYTYKQFFEIADWIPIIDLDVPTHKATLLLSIPFDYQVNTWESNVLKGTVDTVSGKVYHTWFTHYDGSLNQELYSPELTHFLPNVKIVPENFVFDIEGSTATWQTFGEWQHNLIQGLTELPENEKIKVQTLINDAVTKEDIIKILYHYLQDNTRYINVSIKTGGLKPFPASYVVENRYGDCKALTIFMKALLDLCNIKSHYTIIYAGLQPPELIIELPGLQFNHVILTIPLDNDTIWLENTNYNSPFGYLGAFTQNRQALLIQANKSKLIRIPEHKKEDVLCSKNYQFSINVDGNADLFLNNCYRGYEFEQLKDLQIAYNTEEQNEIIHELIPFPDFGLKFWRLVHSGRDSREIHLISQLSLNNMVGELRNERYFSIVPLNVPEFEPPADRSLPVRLPYPVYSSDTLAYSLKYNYRQMIVPEDTILVNKYGKYHLSFVQQGNTLLVFREFYLNSGFIPLEEYTKFYKFLSTVKTLEKKKILIL